MTSIPSFFFTRASRRRQSHTWLPAAAVALFVAMSLLAGSCGTDAPPMGSAVEERDSMPVMVTYGVSKLISDSGVIRYKIIAEEWQVYDKTQPPRQVFPKGIFMVRFDTKFGVNLHITADTAYWYNQSLWELRGRVFIENMENHTTFRTEELFWDMDRHQFYSHKYMHIVEPSQELEGNWFISDEQMNVYHVKKTKGFIPMPGNTAVEAPADSVPMREGPQRPGQ